MIYKLKNLAIPYKIYIPLLFIIAIGLSVIINNSATDKVWILLAVYAIIILTLVVLLDLTIRRPIAKLLLNVKNINVSIANGLCPIEIYDEHKLKYSNRDEIGVVSIEINTFLKQAASSFSAFQDLLIVDSLTKLQNRQKMIIDIQKASYLVIIDIHHFREKNEFYGHEIGDEILKDLAQRVKSHFANNSMNVYYLGSDEFGVLGYKRNSSKKDFYNKVHEFIKLNEKYELKIDENIDVTTRLTCGIAYTKENLLINTHIAHKHAKKINQDISEYCEKINTDEEYKKNLDWTKELSSAIKEDRIIVYFQPIVDVITKKIKKYEILMRLKKRDGEIISPVHFLEISKKTRMYKNLTNIVVTKAFDKFSDSDYSFSINLCVEDIIANDIGKWFFDLAKEKKVSNRVIIELVESEGIDIYDEMNAFIRKAKECGMKIAIDDFGTGYSNFEYLIKLDADFIKIDGSLIGKINTDKKLCNVVEAIVCFANKNDIEVIGEYVSSKEIYDKTKLIGIDYAQGCYLGMASSSL
ncbi:MAG: EAL domain-containing protein [Sulfurimonas sp.]|nr:EAL domain-containing protein [Sulfurimonas sp.]